MSKHRMRILLGFMVLRLFIPSAVATCCWWETRSYTYICPGDPDRNRSGSYKFLVCASCRPGTSSGGQVDRGGGGGGTSSRKAWGGGNTSALAPDVCALDPANPPKTDKENPKLSNRPEKKDPCDTEESLEPTHSWVDLWRFRYTDRVVDLSVPVRGGYVSIVREYLDGGWRSQNLYPIRVLPEGPESRERLQLGTALFEETEAGSDYFVYEKTYILRTTEGSDVIYTRHHPDGSWRRYRGDNQLALAEQGGARREIPDLGYKYVDGTTQLSGLFAYTDEGVEQQIAWYTYESSPVKQRRLLAAVTTYDPNLVTQPDPAQAQLGVFYTYYDNNAAQHRQGLLHTVTDMHGNVYTYSYDDDNALVGKTLHDAAGGLLKHVNLTYHRSSLSMGTPGNSSDPDAADNGDRVVTLEMLGAETGLPKAVATVQSEDGTTTTFGGSYNERAQIFYAQITRSSGRVDEKWVNRDRRLVQHSINGRVVYHRAAVGRIERITRRDDQVTINEYDEFENLLRKTHPDGAVESWTYEPSQQRMSSYTNPYEATTSWTYYEDRDDDDLVDDDPLSQTYPEPPVRTVHTTLPGGAVEIAGYDKLDRLIFTRNARGTFTRFEYQGQTRLMTRRFHPQTTDYEMTYGYDALGRRIRTTNALGHSTLFFYDQAGRPVGSRDPLGNLSLTVFENGKRVASLQGIPPALQDPQRVPDSGGLMDVQNYLDTYPEALRPSQGPRVNHYAYEDRGMLTHTWQVNSQDVLELVSENQYNVKGQLTSVRNALGHATTYEYDALGNIQAVLTPGRTTDEVIRVETQYNEFGDLVRDTRYFAAPRSAPGDVDVENRYVYDGRGRLRSQQTTYGEDGGNSRSTLYLRDLLGNPTEVRHFSQDQSRSVFSEYDNLGRLTRSYGYQQPEMHYEYDDTGALIRTIDGEGSEAATTYDAYGRPVYVYLTDEEQGPLTYDPQDRSWTGGVLASTTTYDALGRVKRQTDALGSFSERAYDEMGRVTHVSVPWQEEDFGVLPADWTTTDALVEQKMTYSAFGEVLTMASPVQAVDSVDGRIPTITYTYDAQGRKITKTHADGSQAAQYRYNPAGQLAEMDVPVPDTSGHTGWVTTTYTYNPANPTLLEHISHPTGETLMGYNKRLQRQWVTNPLGATEVTLSDEQGRPETTYTYLANTTVWDAQGELIPENAHRSESVTYDPLGKPVIRTLPDHTAANPRKQYFVYDEWGRLESRWGAGELPVQYAYNQRGQMTALRTLHTTPADESFAEQDQQPDFSSFVSETRWDYDTQGRLATKTYPDESTYTYTYFDDGRLKTRVDGEGQTTTYSYLDEQGRRDPRSQIHRISYTHDPELRFSYDAAGRRTRMTDATGQTQWTWSGVYGVDSVTQPLTGATLRYTHDAAGRRKTMAVTVATGDYAATLAGDAAYAQPYTWQTTYNYDRFGRLANIADTRVADPQTLSDLFRYEYHNGSTLDKIYFPGDALYLQQEQDSLGRILNRGVKDLATDATRAVHQYSYNALGQREDETRIGDAAFVGMLPTREFGYDAFRQLTRVQDANAAAVETFEYDLIGNRLFANENAPPADVTYTPNELNQYTAIVEGAVSHEPDYDDNGSLLNDGKREYTWDDENRLASVTMFDEMGEKVSRQEYLYDGLNRRIRTLEQSFNPLTSEWIDQKETLYVYDGVVVVSDIEKNISNGEQTARSYTRGQDLSGSLQAAGGTGGLLAMVQSDVIGSLDTVVHYLSDASGNITALFSPDGSLTATYSYSAFGMPEMTSDIDGSGIASANPFRFSSQIWDEDVSLIHYLYRSYDPEHGRWLNRDPIEEEGGYNLYGFVGNDGVNKRDVLGLDMIPMNLDPNSLYNDASPRPAVFNEMSPIWNDSFSLMDVPYIPSPPKEKKHIPWTIPPGPHPVKMFDPNKFYVPFSSSDEIVDRAEFSMVPSSQVYINGYPVLVDPCGDHLDAVRKNKIGGTKELPFYYKLASADGQYIVVYFVPSEFSTRTYIVEGSLQLFAPMVVGYMKSRGIAPRTTRVAEFFVGSDAPNRPPQTGGGEFSGSANELYDAIRGSTTDVDDIARHTGYKPANIQNVKDHVFNQEHLLDRYVDLGEPAVWARFDSDLGQAQSWLRLQNGTHTADDLKFLFHETAESWYMRTHGPGYNAAHNAADKLFPMPKLPVEQ